MNAIYVHTLGDSSLDNIYWMLNDDGKNVEEAKKHSVEGQLQEALGTNYKVESHAFDGFTTTSLLKGDKVGQVLPAKQKSKKDAYLKGKNITAKTAKVDPLKELKKSVEANPKSTHFVIISVGGNDFREQLSSPMGFLGELPKIQERYLQILDQVKKLGKEIRPVIMLQYQLDANNDQYGVYETLGTISPFLGIEQGKNAPQLALQKLFKMFYAPILEKAQKEKIPVLDLPNTFDPHKELYISQIEPNQEGGKLIAEGLSQIITTHKVNDESKLYSKSAKQTSFTASKNIGAEKWTVSDFSGKK